MKQKFTFSMIILISLFSLGCFGQTGNTCQIQSNFNSSPIAAGSWIWFNARIQLTKYPAGSSGWGWGGSTTKAFTVSIANANIAFTTPGGASYSLPVPNSTITFDPNARGTSSFFDGTKWNTTIPYSSAGASQIFLTGLSFQVPAGGLPGGLTPVNCTGTFSGSDSTVCLNWQWSAAVYKSFTNCYNSLSVSLLNNCSGQAGAPTSCCYGHSCNCVSGGTGPGGSNLTGLPGGSSPVVLTSGNTTPSAPVAQLSEPVSKHQPFQNDLIVGPNPSCGQITVKSKDIENGTATFMITNISGVTVQTKTVSIDAKGQSWNFDLSRYGKGMYFVKLLSENGEEDQKVIVQ